MGKKPEKIIEPIPSSFEDVISKITPKVTPYEPPQQLEMNFELVEYTNPEIIDPIDFYNRSRNPKYLGNTGANCSTI